jgi:hypothetical protein
MYGVIRAKDKRTNNKYTKFQIMQKYTQNFKLCTNIHIADNIILVLRFSRLEFNVKIRLSGMSRVEF